MTRLYPSAAKRTCMLAPLGVLLVGCLSDAQSRDDGASVGSDDRVEASAETKGRPDSSASPCVVFERERYHLPLGRDVQVYVEPHGFAAFEGGLILTGQPTYEWTTNESRQTTMAGQGRFFGVISESGGVREIEHPPGIARPGWSRLVVLGPSKWGFLVEELDDSLPGLDEPVRIVYAEYDGSMWSTPEELPVPQGGRVTVAEGSSIVRHDDGSVSWAARFPKERGGVDVLLFGRSASGWSHSVAVEDWVDEVGLHPGDSDGPWLAVAGLDPEFGSQLASTRWVRRPGPQRETTRLSRGASGDRFRSPRFADGAGSTVLAWRHMEGSSPFGEAWLQRGLVPGPTGAAADLDAPVLLDPSVLDLRPLPLSDGSTLWITHHLESVTETQTLRVTLDDGITLTIIAELPNPYLGPFRAALSPSNDILIVGPDFDQDPMFSSVRSLVLRLGLSCT